jgi:molybdopterin-guanine dinucleotide biosynthesis protein A
MASAAILAGGAARRFGGRDKGALVLGGQTILERQLAALRPLTDDIMLVGRAPAGPGRPGLRPVADRVSGRGPLGGLDAALDAARDDEVVVLACDMPFVTTALLRHLVSLAAGADVVVPVTDRGYHPLCAVYTRVCRAAISRHLAENRLAIRDLFGGLRVRVVTGDDLDAFGDRDHLLANVNTLAEYEELEALPGHHG